MAPLPKLPLSQADISSLLRELNPETVNFANRLVKALRLQTEAVFGFSPCLWQIRVALAILKHDRDVVCIAGTGSGKTITFWMPLLLREDSIIVVVSPLKVLGEQNVNELNGVGIAAIHVNGDTATSECFKEIGDGKFRVIVTNPETITQSDGGFRDLFKQSKFKARINAVVFDEAHCVKQWGSFRPEFYRLGHLRSFLKEDGIDVPFLVTSATLPKVVLGEVKRILNIRVKNLSTFRRPVDRTNVSIVVVEIQRGRTASFKDAIELLFPLGWEPGDKLPPKYLIFCNTISETHKLGLAIQDILPPGMKNLTGWVCSEMSNEYVESSVEEIRDGDAHGRAATDSCGMGLNLPNIGLVGQFKAGASMCTIWQRFGRAARNPTTHGIAVLFAESKYFDPELRGKNILKGSFKNYHGVPTDRNDTCQANEPAASAYVDGHNGIPGASGNTDVVFIVEEVADTAQDEEPGIQGDDNHTETDAEAFKKSRKATYEEFMRQQMQPSQNGKWKQQDRDDDGDCCKDPAVHDVINAGNRPHLKCRRIPVLWCLDEDLKQANDHLLCRPDLPNGCDRCRAVLSKPYPCCDICHPEAFSFMFNPPASVSDDPAPSISTDVPPSNSSLPPSLPTRSRIPKKRDRTARRYLNIKQALETWRQDKAKSLLGGWNRFGGPAFVLPQTVLERICDCADEGRISTLMDLKVETLWAKADMYGAEVLELITTHCPPLPPKKKQKTAKMTMQRTPLAGPSRTFNNAVNECNNAPLVALPDASASKGLRKQSAGKREGKGNTKCSACGVAGHNRNNKKCKDYGKTHPLASTNSLAIVEFEISEVTNAK